MPIRPLKRPSEYDGPGLATTVGIIAGLTSVMAVFTFACAPGPQAIVEASQVRHATIPPIVEAIHVYNDPGGCQYIIFENKGNSSFEVVVRQAKNTNGMCKKASL